MPPLHLDAVAQILGDVLAQQLRRKDPVDHVAGDGHVEPTEQLGRLQRVQDHQLLRDQHEEEGRAAAVGEDAGGHVDPLPDILELLQDAVLLGLLAADAGHHLFILPHLLPQLRDLGDPLIVDLGHAEVIQSMPQGDQVVNVVVVAALHHNVHHGVEDGALLHRRLGGGRLDVVLDLRGHLIQAIHVQDLAPDLLLILLDPAISVDLLGPEVGHDLHRALAEDVPLEDVREAGLGVDGEDQHLIALPGQPVSRGGGEGGLAQPALAAEHDVAALGVLPKQLRQRGGHPGSPRVRDSLDLQNIASATSRSRSMRRFQVLIWGTT